MWHGEAVSDVEKRHQVRRNCTRSLSGHDEPTTRERLASLIALPESEGYPDVYSVGGPVTVLERRVADLLDKPAARFVVKGVIAQQAALRTWTDSSRTGTVALHPLSHLDHDELGAFERLHPLRGIRLGGKRGFGVEHLEQVGEPLGVVVVELPLRNAGFVLPEWDDLVAVSHWCRKHGVPLHFDGARLWESAPYYGRGLPELADLADSVYVSFYKGLGGLAGCALVGSEDFLARATPWLTRHGANVYASYPYALAAIDGLNRYLPRMGAYLERATTLAAAIAEVDGLSVTTPQTNGFRVFLPGTAGSLRDAHLRFAERTGTWLFQRADETDVPGLSVVEVVVGEATEAFTDAEAARLFADFLASAEGDR